MGERSEPYTGGCSIEISHDVSVGRTVGRCVQKCVGGITWPKHAHAQSQILAVKTDLGQCGQCGCGFVPQTHSEKLATMLIIQTRCSYNIGTHNRKEYRLSFYLILLYVPNKLYLIILIVSF